jgi:hypothetical protein
MMPRTPAQRSLEFSVYDPEVERQLLEHSVVQTELHRQQRDLALLEADDANAVLNLTATESAFTLPKAERTSA